jgi:hypothetical protein
MSVRQLKDGRWIDKIPDSARCGAAGDAFGLVAMVPYALSWRSFA